MLHFKIFLKYNGATNESPIIVSITPGLRVNSLVKKYHEGFVKVTNVREQDNKRNNKDSNFVHFGENSSSLVRAVIAASIFENIIIPSSRFNFKSFH